MSALLGTFALALLAGISFAVATSLAAVLCWPLLHRGLRRGTPARRARTALALAVAPTWLPAVLIGVCFVPGILGFLGLHADHCPQHPGHPHLCLVHPTAPLSASLAGLLLGFAGLLGVAALRGLWRARRGRMAIAQLRLGALQQLGPGVSRVDSDRPFSVTAGMGRGEIFVSSALAEALPAEQLEAVLEHERAHVRRRDALRRVLARALSLPHLPFVRRALLLELALATEQACDEEAALRLGNRLCVAEAILAAERLLVGTALRADEAFLAFGGSSVPERVRGLLQEPVRKAEWRAGWWPLAALAVGAWLAMDPLHEATEHLLGLLLAAR